MSKLSTSKSIYQELTDEALVSEHTAQAAEGRESLAMSELFNEDARLWRRMADGWDVGTALTTSESAWKSLCRKPKLRGKGFEPAEWERRMNSYTGWRMSSILAGGEKLFRIIRLDTEGEHDLGSVPIGRVRSSFKAARSAHRIYPVAISPSGRRYSWESVFSLPIFREDEPREELVYVSLVDENETPVNGGLLLGPIDSLNADILELVQSLRRRYLIDHPEMAPEMGVELVEVVSTVEGRLNGHPIWGEMFEEAVGGAGE
jgi:hypothetical protein